MIMRIYDLYSYPRFHIIVKIKLILFIYNLKDQLASLYFSSNNMLVPEDRKEQN